jgi:hypothetical protein
MKESTVSPQRSAFSRKGQIRDCAELVYELQILPVIPAKAGIHSSKGLLAEPWMPD